jgi:hypothetical protein
VNRDGLALFWRSAGAGFKNFDFDVGESHAPIPVKPARASIPHPARSTRRPLSGLVAPRRGVACRRPQAPTSDAPTQTGKTCANRTGRRVIDGSKTLGPSAFQRSPLLALLPNSFPDLSLPNQNTLPFPPRRLPPLFHKN